MDFLCPERHEDGAALRRERPQRVNPPQAIREDGVQSIFLLVTQNRKSAELFLRDGLQRLRVRVKLLQRIGNVYERHAGKHEPLVTGGQIFQQIFGLRAHLLQVIRYGRGEIVLPVLPLLPAGYIRFHAEDSGLYFPYRFFRWDRQNVNGQQQVSGEVGQVFYHFVADKAGIIAHEQDAPKLAAHFKIACTELQPIRADQVAEVNAALDICRQVEPERRFFAGAEEIMQEP